MNLPSEFDLITMERRALLLDELQEALEEKRAQHSNDELPLWIGQHFDEDDAKLCAEAIRTLVATVRSLPR